MKLLALCSVAFPMFLGAKPIAFPTMRGYTLSQFTSNLSALDAASTAYTATEFTVAPRDAATVDQGGALTLIDVGKTAARSLAGVPEPVTFVLIGLGLMGITYGGRKLPKRGASL